MNRVTDDAGLRPALTDLAFHILIGLGYWASDGSDVRAPVERRTSIRVLGVCAYLRA